MSINSELQQKYINYYVELHKKDPLYGNGANELMEYILPFIIELSPKSILDYGSGKCDFAEQISACLGDCIAYKYDPAIKELSVLPVDKAELVINTDVMEHIPEENIDSTLEKISKISKKAYFNICITLSEDILPNGKNAHVTVKSAEWWQSKIEKYFQAAYPVITRDRDCAFITWRPNQTYYAYINMKNREKRDIIKKIIQSESSLIKLEEAFDNLNYKYRKQFILIEIEKILKVQPDAKIVIFGAGKLSKDALNSLGKKIDNIVAILDNDKEKHGKKLMGYEIYPKEFLYECAVDYLIFAIQKPEQVQESIKDIINQLEYKLIIL